MNISKTAGATGCRIYNNKTRGIATTQRMRYGRPHAARVCGKELSSAVYGSVRRLVGRDDSFARLQLRHASHVQSTWAFSGLRYVQLTRLRFKGLSFCEATLSRELPASLSQKEVKLFRGIWLEAHNTKW